MCLCGAHHHVAGNPAAENLAHQAERDEKHPRSAPIENGCKAGGIFKDEVGNVKPQRERCPVYELDQVQYPGSSCLVLRGGELPQRLLRGCFYGRPCHALREEVTGESRCLSRLCCADRLIAHGLRCMMVVLVLDLSATGGPELDRVDGS